MVYKERIYGAGAIDRMVSCEGHSGQEDGCISSSGVDNLPADVSE